MDDNMTDLSTALAAIKKEDPTGYGHRPLRCTLDDVLGVFVRAFVAAAPLERRRIAAQGDQTLSRVLLVFAERMASLAVRVQSRTYLTSGMIALAAEGWMTESRENLSILSLLHDAAIRIGADPRETLEQVRQYATKSVTSSIEKFLKRSKEDKSIEAMGYVATADGDGFRYERTW
jgi:hypothetical protein